MRLPLLFFGSGAFGIPTLETLHRSHDLLAVVTQPDKPAGRKRVLTPTPVANWAATHQLPIYKQADVNEATFAEQMASLEPHASVVIAFGQKLGEPLIRAMGKLAVNLHGSLLPKYRGAAPINWAMIEGERKTGVSVISLAQRMDAGEIHATASVEIDPNETAGELHDRLAMLGPEAVLRVLDDLVNDQLMSQEQDESQASKAPKLRKTDGTVSFALPAEQVRQRVHGLTPWPGCTVQWHREKTGEMQSLILHRVAVEAEAAGNATPGTVVSEDACVAAADGVVRLLEVQPPGKRVMEAKAFLAGYAMKPGDILTPRS